MLRKVLVLLLAASIAIAGCSSNTNRPSSTSALHPTTSSVDGREVKTTSCETAVFNAAPKKKIVIGKLHGVLELRKSGSCNRAYWTRFTPKLGNKANFTVSIRISTRQMYTQDSEPLNPAAVAYTPIAQGSKGERIRWCVIATHHPRKCWKATVV